MCESNVYIVSGSSKELVMEDVARMIVEADRVVCIDTMGDRKVVLAASISEANLVKHEILLRSRA